MEKIISLVLLLLLGIHIPVSGQRFPDPSQNIDNLVIFGKDASGTWGDSDKIQIFFVMVPNWIKFPVYLRVFDPDTGGKFDEVNRKFNTRIRYTILGGPNVHPSLIPENWEQTRESRSGTLIDQLELGEDPELDNQWFTFRALNPADGQTFGSAKIFKVVVEGISGDDGNLCHFFLSKDPDELDPVNMANFFSYEISVRLPPHEQIKIYPQIQRFANRINLNIFDYDKDGKADYRPPAGPECNVNLSGNGDWEFNFYRITPVDEDPFSVIEIFCFGQTRSNNTVINVTSAIAKEGSNLPNRLYASPFGHFHPDGLVPFLVTPTKSQ